MTRSWGDQRGPTDAHGGCRPSKQRWDKTQWRPCRVPEAAGRAGAVLRHLPCKGRTAAFKSDQDQPSPCCDGLWCEPGEGSGVGGWFQERSLAGLKTAQTCATWWSALSRLMTAATWWS